MTVISAPGWGGLHAVVERTSPLIKKSGFERVVVLPVSETSVRLRLEGAGCTVIHRNLARPRKSLSPRLGWHFLSRFGSDVEALCAIARENQVSIIEAAGLHNLQPVVAARRLHLPLVWQFHSTAAPRPIRVVIGCLASRLAAVVMTSGKGMISRHGGLGQVADRVVPFCAPLDLSRFRRDLEIRRQIRSDWGYTDQDVVVGTLGNRGWQKNQGMIVNIARRLRDQNLPFKFAICGNPLDTNVHYFESKVTKPIAKHGLAQGDYVRVFAQTVAPEIIMNGFDVFLLTSVAEGASLVTAEALATGLPVVATDVGSLPDVVHRNENGMLVPVNDIEGAAQALRRLADPELRAKMGRQSRAIAESSVSSERCAAAHVEAYRRALRTDSCRDAAQSVAGPVSATGTPLSRASRPPQGMAGEGTTPGG